MPMTIHVHIGMTFGWKNQIYVNVHVNPCARLALLFKVFDTNDMHGKEIGRTMEPDSTSKTFLDAKELLVRRILVGG